jgi:hypothetical protein
MFHSLWVKAQNRMKASDYYRVMNHFLAYGSVWAFSIAALV